MSCSMLISYARNRGDRKGRRLIYALPFSHRKGEQLGILYQRQELLSDAEKFWEHRAKRCGWLQRDLINMLEIVHKNGRRTQNFWQICRKGEPSVVFPMDVHTLICTLW